MTEEILKVSHLNKFYGDWQALHDINFDLKKGEVLALLGPSGSGKSTLIRCLNGLEEYRDGEIVFNGAKVEPSEKNWQRLRQKIGMVFQSYDLFPNMTVLENILLGPTKVQKRDRATVEQEALALLDRVGLKEHANSYPRQLSGGQKQRVAIVRALALQPEVMLFDEVTASLDPEMVRGILDIIKELANDGSMTMLIVTHEMDFALSISDRVVMMENGVVASDVPPQRIRNGAEDPALSRIREFMGVQ